jgi:ABC-2 type transport system permease protein
VAPACLLAIAVIPAVINVGVAYLTRDTPAQGVEFITYREYVGVSSALLLFVALVAPDIVCPDRRQRVLPLIFARPLTGTDYALAKIGAIFTCVFAFSFLPQVVLYVGQMLVSNGAIDYLRHNTAVLWQVPVAVALLALFYAVLGVAVASLTSRRMVAGATMLGVTLVSSAVAGILVRADGGGPNGTDGGGHPAALINILALPLRVRDLVFLGHLDPQSPLSGVAGGGVMSVAAYVVVVAACIAVVLARYRSVEA